MIPRFPDLYGPHVFKCCTSASGDVKMGYDGSTTSTVASGAGSGILATPPSVVYLGTYAASGPYMQIGSAAYSDIAVCAVSDPNQCGDWARPGRRVDAAIGDSITVGIGNGDAVTNPWPQVAGVRAGTSISQIGRASWYTFHALPGWESARQHRYRKIAVLLGINDVGTLTGPVLTSSAAIAFEALRQLYGEIIKSGAVPIPMTVLPTTIYTGANEAERRKLNVSILRWCQDTGYACADASSFFDNGTGGAPKAAWISGDGIHPNQAGHTALGGFMANYFRDCSAQ
jgi:lysophospholipase L1-like esterase